MNRFTLLKMRAVVTIAFIFNSKLSFRVNHFLTKFGSGGKPLRFPITKIFSHLLLFSMSLIFISFFEEAFII